MSIVTVEIVKDDRQISLPVAANRRLTPVLLTNILASPVKFSCWMPWTSNCRWLIVTVHLPLWRESSSQRPHNTAARLHVLAWRLSHWSPCFPMTYS